MSSDLPPLQKFGRLRRSGSGENVKLSRGTEAQPDRETGHDKRTEGFGTDGSGQLEDRGLETPAGDGNLRGHPLSKSIADLLDTDPATGLDERATPRATGASPSCYVPFGFGSSVPLNSKSLYRGAIVPMELSRVAISPDPACRPGPWPCRLFAAEKGRAYARRGNNDPLCH